MIVRVGVNAACVGFAGDCMWWCCVRLIRLLVTTPYGCLCLGCLCWRYGDVCLDGCGGMHDL